MKFTVSSMGVTVSLPGRNLMHGELGFPYKTENLEINVSWVEKPKAISLKSSKEQSEMK